LYVQNYEIKKLNLFFPLLPSDSVYQEADFITFLVENGFPTKMARYNMLQMHKLLHEPAQIQSSTTEPQGPNCFRYYTGGEKNSAWHTASSNVLLL